MNTEQHAEKIVNIEHVDNVFLAGKDSALPTMKPAEPTVLGKHYITDIPKTRYVLDDYCDDDEFEFYPDRLYVLTLYFITLAQGRDHYALFDYVSYAPHIKSGRINDDIWSVPHTTIPIDLADRKVRKVKEIRNVYAQALEGMTEKLAVLEYNLFYNLGIVYKEMDAGREYIEYKQSTTEPDKMRCNYIREFFVHDVDSTGILNLTDPECLKQHRYLQLDLLGSLPCPDGLYRFMDKPIPDNVADVLLNDRRKITASAVKIRQADLVYKMSGMLFIITMTDYRGDFFSNYLVQTVIDQGMMYAGIGRYSIDGRHIVGIMPYGESNFTDLLGRLYEGISKLTKRLILHCTALYCHFDFGKTLDLCSQRPGFSGEGYDKLKQMDTETMYARVSMQDDNFCGIFFGWDQKDNDRIRFSGKEIQLKKYDANNRTMNFKRMDKGK